MTQVCGLRHNLGLKHELFEINEMFQSERSILHFCCPTFRAKVWHKIQAFKLSKGSNNISILCHLKALLMYKAA